MPSSSTNFLPREKAVRGAVAYNTAWATATVVKEDNRGNPGHDSRHDTPFSPMKSQMQMGQSPCICIALRMCLISQKCISVLPYRVAGGAVAGKKKQGPDGISLLSFSSLMKSFLLRGIEIRPHFDIDAAAAPHVVRDNCKITHATRSKAILFCVPTGRLPSSPTSPSKSAISLSLQISKYTAPPAPLSISISHP